MGGISVEPARKRDRWQHHQPPGTAVAGVGGMLVAGIDGGEAATAATPALRLAGGTITTARPPAAGAVCGASGTNGGTGGTGAGGDARRTSDRRDHRGRHLRLVGSGGSAAPAATVRMVLAGGVRGECCPRPSTGTLAAEWHAWYGGQQPPPNRRGTDGSVDPNPTGCGRGWWGGGKYGTRGEGFGPRQTGAAHR